MSFMYKSMGAKHSNWQLSQNNQFVSYALLSWGEGSIVRQLQYQILKNNKKLWYQLWCHSLQLSEQHTRGCMHKHNYHSSVILLVWAYLLIFSVISEAYCCKVRQHVGFRMAQLSKWHIRRFVNDLWSIHQHKLPRNDP